MSAPTPEKLRSLAGRLPMPSDWERPFLNGSLSLNEEIVDALRDCAGILEDQDGLVDQHIVARLSADRDRLRSLIDAAPHGWACDFNFVPGVDRLPDNAECTCWKVSAL